MEREVETGKEREGERSCQSLTPFSSSPAFLKKKKKNLQGLLSRLWQLSVLACAVLGAAIFHESWGRLLISSMRDLMGRGSSNSSRNGVRVGFSLSPNKGI